LNAWLGRPQDCPLRIRKVPFKFRSILYPIIKRLFSLLFIEAWPPVENEKSTSVFRVIDDTQMMVWMLTVYDGPNDTDKNIHGGLTEQVNRPTRRRPMDGAGKSPAKRWRAKLPRLGPVERLVRQRTELGAAKPPQVPVRQMWAGRRPRRMACTAFAPGMEKNGDAPQTRRNATQGDYQDQAQRNAPERTNPSTRLSPGHVCLTNEAHRPRLHRGAERSRGSRELRESGRQCRRGPSAAEG